MMHAICEPMQSRPWLTLWVFSRVGGHARRGGVGACYVHMAANASFTNSHQMMDSDKMGMNDHIEVSRNLLDVLHSYFGVDEIRQKCTTALFAFLISPQTIVTVRSFTFLGFILPLVHLEPEVEINTSLTSFFSRGTKTGKQKLLSVCRFCQQLKQNRTKMFS